MRNTSIIALIITILFSLSSGVSHAEELAIIVNKENPIKEISFRELVKILKQERQYWEDGKKIYLIMRESGSSEKEIVLKKIYRMNDRELKKFWLAKMFRGEISTFPKVLSSNQAVKRFVSRARQAIGFIGFIKAELVDDTVKILPIEGKLPGEAGYPLRDEGRETRDEKDK